jgi:hypothetical protein
MLSWERREVAQIMYTLLSKCKNDKRRKKKMGYLNGAWRCGPII